MNDQSSPPASTPSSDATEYGKHSPFEQAQPEPLLTPAEVVARYREAGYDFVALTDHLLARYGWQQTDATDLSEFTRRLRASARFDQVSHPDFERVDTKGGEEGEQHLTWSFDLAVRRWD